MGRLLNESVVWRPYVRPAGGTYVKTTPTPDPIRPVRGETIDDPLRAVVSWRSTTAPVEGAGGNTEQGGQIAGAALLIDIERAYFEDDYATHGYPKKGDRFELPEQKNAADRLVEITRMAEDGSARLLFWCAVVR